MYYGLTWYELTNMNILAIVLPTLLFVFLGFADPQTCHNVLIEYLYINYKPDNNLYLDNKFCMK